MKSVFEDLPRRNVAMEYSRLEMTCRLCNAKKTHETYEATSTNIHRMLELDASFMMVEALDQLV